MVALEPPPEEPALTGVDPPDESPLPLPLPDSPFGEDVPPFEVLSAVPELDAVPEPVELPLPVDEPEPFDTSLDADWLNPSAWANCSSAVA